MTTSATSKQWLSWKWLYLLEYDLSMNAVPQLTILFSVWPTDWRHLCFDHKAHEWVFENLLEPLSVSKYLVRVWVRAHVCLCAYTRSGHAPGSYLSQEIRMGPLLGVLQFCKRRGAACTVRGRDTPLMLLTACFSFIYKRLLTEFNNNQEYASEREWLCLIGSCIH